MAFCPWKCTNSRSKIFAGFAGSLARVGIKSTDSRRVMPDPELVKTFAERLHHRVLASPMPSFSRISSIAVASASNSTSPRSPIQTSTGRRPSASS